MNELVRGGGGGGAGGGVGGGGAQCWGTSYSLRCKRGGWRVLLSSSTCVIYLMSMRHV